MWGAECQSHWKQLLILTVLCQPHECRPQGWHGPGAGAMEEADISLPGAGTEQQAGVLSPVCPAPRSGRLAARQVGKEFCSKALSCLQVFRSFSARGTALILEFFSCWFFELLNWMLSWLLDSQKYWCEGPLSLPVSEYFVHWTPCGGFG